MSESAVRRNNSQQAFVGADITAPPQTATPSAQHITSHSARRNHPFRAVLLSGTLFGILALLLGLGIERVLTRLAVNTTASNHRTLILAALAASLLFALAPPFFAGALASARRYGPRLGSLAGALCYLIATLLSFALNIVKHHSTTWQQAALLLLFQLLIGLALGALGGQYSCWQRRWTAQQRAGATPAPSSSAKQAINPSASTSALRRRLDLFLAWCSRPDVRLAFGLTLALRIGTLVISVLVSTVPLGPYRLVGELPLQSINHLLAAPPPPTVKGWTGFLVGPWDVWDASWLTTVAALGYAGYYGRTAFMPVYPLLVHIVAIPLGGNVIVSALLVSTIACFGALIVFYRLIERLGAKPDTTRWTVIVAAFLPISFFFVAGYTESVFLLVSLGAILASLNRQWGRMALLAVIATLTRTQGLLLSVFVVPVLFDALRGWARARWAIASLGKTIRAVAAPILAALAGPAAYVGWAIALYMVRLPLPWEPLGSTKGWGLQFTWPGEGILADLLALGHPVTGMGLQSDILDAGAAALVAVLIVVAARRLPLAFTLYGVFIWCLALIKVLPDGETMSAARYLLPLLPLALLPGAWLARHAPLVRVAWVAVACVPLMFFTWYYIMGAWVN
jgi:hypothetical protein